MEKEELGSNQSSLTAIESEREFILGEEETHNIVQGETSADRKRMLLKREFEKRRCRQGIASIPFMAAVVGLVLAGFPDLGRVMGFSQDLVFPIVGLAVIAFFGYSLVNWRCPSCNRYFGQRLNPKRCSGCGTDFRD